VIKHPLRCLVVALLHRVFHHDARFQDLVQEKGHDSLTNVSFDKRNASGGDRDVVSIEELFNTFRRYVQRRAAEVEGTGAGTRKEPVIQCSVQTYATNLSRRQNHVTCANHVTHSRPHHSLRQTDKLRQTTRCAFSFKKHGECPIYYLTTIRS